MRDGHARSVSALRILVHRVCTGDGNAYKPHIWGTPNPIGHVAGVPSSKRSSKVRTCLGCRVIRAKWLESWAFLRKPGQELEVLQLTAQHKST